MREKGERGKKEIEKGRKKEKYCYSRREEMLKIEEKRKFTTL